ncbi:hypothetical protein ZIOFF_017081 [Zingiber officinale]|uniref:Uncharacterized protein n=1 Tax=Zingiber officinale TaxID=94328 RepID=A0A8J5LI29_ZINOF|nr:hypothetical protein ZIOFF_017081 [Zingiber officinale]
MRYRFPYSLLFRSANPCPLKCIPIPRCSALPPIASIQTPMIAVTSPVLLPCHSIRRLRTAPLLTISSSLFGRRHRWSTEPKTSTGRNLDLTIDAEVIAARVLAAGTRFLRSSEASVRGFLSDGSDAFHDLQTSVRVDSARNRVVFSCRQSSIVFVANLLLWSFVAVLVARTVLWLRYGFRSGWRLIGSEVIRRDRSLGGKEVVVGRRLRRGNRNTKSFRVSANPLSTVRGYELQTSDNEARTWTMKQEKLPNWWPDPVPPPVISTSKQDYQREIDRLVRGHATSRAISYLLANVQLTLYQSVNAEYLASTSSGGTGVPTLLQVSFLDDSQLLGTDHGFVSADVGLIGKHGEGLMLRPTRNISASDILVQIAELWIPSLMQLRELCKVSGVKVSFETANARDSFYRASVDFVLNCCSRKQYRAIIPSEKPQVGDEDARQFIAGLADNIGLTNSRAATLVSAAVAARTRSCFLQCWALEVQGKRSEALEELSKLCLIHLAFPPEENSRTVMDIFTTGSLFCSILVRCCRRSRNRGAEAGTILLGLDAAMPKKVDASQFMSSIAGAKGREEGGGEAGGVERCFAPAELGVPPVGDPPLEVRRKRRRDSSLPPPQEGAPQSTMEIPCDILKQSTQLLASGSADASIGNREA